MTVGNPPDTLVHCSESQEEKFELTGSVEGLTHITENYERFT